ncbi:MAG: DUF3179 domain-containing protein [Chloroflexi bacterium]|nr:DUF3179 domain-containing protein [Chloroflexota bacterium]
MAPRLHGFVFALVALATACAPAPPPAPPDPSPAPRATIVPTTTMPDLSRLRFSTIGWKTDFSRHTVPLDDLDSGGPPRDGIPPIDQPRFVTPAEADGWLKDSEPVIAFALQGEARAYPLQVLIWHEIVNDEVAGMPVAITFCPLCNTAIAFDRRLEGVGTLRFGTTGNLRHSDLVMWDDRTESWWQQATGEAIVGQLAGTRLRFLPASIVSYRDFKATFASGRMLSRETGYARPYGSNPYVGYDNVKDSPFLFKGTPDPRLPPMERVVTVELNGQAAAYPFRLLQPRGVILDSVGSVPIVVFWARGTSSALDQASIANSRDIGATGVFRPVLEGRALTFESRQGTIVDRETGSAWNVLGQATAGPLQGQRLEPAIHGNHFWFAAGVFNPAIRVWRPSDS